MPLSLRLNRTPDLPLEVESLRPDQLKSGSAEELGQLKVWTGRYSGPAREFFEIQGDAAADQTLRFEGDCQRLDGIGAAMSSGTIHVQGAAGQRAGWEMQGGELSIQGDVDDWAGVAMTGGRLVVHGSAGDHLGGVPVGQQVGMNRGEILVQKDAGRGAGRAMRRGLLVVGGRVGELMGWQMRAGTMLALGGWGRDPGIEMRRGTLVLCGESAQDTPEACSKLPVSFVAGMCGLFPMMPLLAVRLKEIGQLYPGLFSEQQISKLLGPFQMFHGDQLAGARGELLLQSARTTGS